MLTARFVRSPCCPAPPPTDALFSNAALGPIIEEWAEKYEDEEDEALWELVVFLIRVRRAPSPFARQDPACMRAHERRERMLTALACTHARQASGSSAAIEKEKAVDLDGVPSFVDDLEKEVRLRCACAAVSYADRPADPLCCAPLAPCSTRRSRSGRTRSSRATRRSGRSTAR